MIDDHQSVTSPTTRPVQLADPAPDMVNQTMMDVLGYKVMAKIQDIDNEFRKRFPRDNSKPSSQSRFYVPRRKTEIDDIVDYMGDDPNAGLSDKEKVDEIMYSLDEDGDGLAGPWE